MIIVPEYAAFSDLPDEVCEKVWLDRDVVPQLVDAVSRYLDDPAGLAAMEIRVRNYAANHLSLDQARADLREILNLYWS